MRKIWIAAIALVVSACSPGSDLPLAQAEVAKFHQLAAAEKYADIYAAASPDMKKTASEEQLTDLLSRVHAVIGNFKSAPVPGWKDSVDNGNHFVTLDVESVYERGTATEQFVYRIQDGKAMLAGYDVKSKPTNPAPAASASAAASDEATNDDSAERDSEK